MRSVLCCLIANDDISAAAVTHFREASPKVKGPKMSCNYSFGQAAGIQNLLLFSGKRHSLQVNAASRRGPTFGMQMLSETASRAREEIVFLGGVPVKMDFLCSLLPSPVSRGAKWWMKNERQDRPRRPNVRIFATRDNGRFSRKQVVWLSSLTPSLPVRLPRFTFHFLPSASSAPSSPLSQGPNLGKNFDRERPFSLSSMTEGQAFR